MTPLEELATRVSAHLVHHRGLKIEEDRARNALSFLWKIIFPS